MQEFHFDPNGGTLIDQWAVWWLEQQQQVTGPQMVEWMKLESIAEGTVNNAMGVLNGARARREAIVRHSGPAI